MIVELLPGVGRIVGVEHMPEKLQATSQAAAWNNAVYIFVVWELPVEDMPIGENPDENVFVA